MMRAWIGKNERISDHILEDCGESGQELRTRRDAASCPGSVVIDRQNRENSRERRMGMFKGSFKKMLSEKQVLSPCVWDCYSMKAV